MAYHRENHQQSKVAASSDAEPLFHARHHHHHRDQRHGNQDAATQPAMSSQHTASSTQQQAAGILMYPLDVTYDTVYMPTPDLSGRKGGPIDLPYKLVKMVPQVNVQQQIAQAMRPFSVDEARAMAVDLEKARRAGQVSSSNKQEAFQDNLSDADKLRELVTTVEGIVKQYGRPDVEAARIRSEAEKSMHASFQADLNHARPQPKVGRNVRAVSPTPQTPPAAGRNDNASTLAQFEAALQTRAGACQIIAETEMQQSQR